MKDMIEICACSYTCFLAFDLLNLTRIVFFMKCVQAVTLFLM